MVNTIKVFGQNNPVQIKTIVGDLSVKSVHDRVVQPVESVALYQLQARKSGNIIDRNLEPLMVRFEVDSPHVNDDSQLFEPIVVVATDEMQTRNGQILQSFSQDSLEVRSSNFDDC